jgi:hypothetical protein
MSRAARIRPRGRKRLILCRLPARSRPAACRGAVSAAGVADRAPAPEGAPSIRRPPAGQCRAGAADQRSLGRLPRIAIHLRELSGRVGWRQALGCLTASARWQPLRGLPASAPVKPVVQQHKPACRHGHGQDEQEHDDRYRKRRPVRNRRQCDHQDREREGRAGKRRDCFLFLVHRFPDGLRRPGSGQPGGDVGSEGGQVRVGP